ncbi:Vitelline membrane outer layer protein 1 [Folsomia candida]|uniref:Vitelline membrane outer layer protein 1 n=1 Tax=Folsomia candida TaxID=158441 RepID=A0A226EX43_FOLCA|nr:Vitelline membrane outer layer protein 1 [Folsomia candida]
MVLYIILWSLFTLLVQFSEGFHHKFVPPRQGRGRRIPHPFGRHRIEGTWITSERVTNWGDWGEESFCPVGSFAIGLRVKYEEFWQDDDTAINGIGLNCAFPSKIGPNGIWEECRCPASPFEAVIGHRLCVLETQGAMDDVSAYGLYIICEKTGLHRCVREIDFGECSPEVVCPEEYPRICGIQTQVEDNQWWLLDQTSLNNVDFYCCKGDTL